MLIPYARVSASGMVTLHPTSVVSPEVTFTLRGLGHLVALGTWLPGRERICMCGTSKTWDEERNVRELHSLAVRYLVLGSEWAQDPGTSV